MGQPLIKPQSRFLLRDKNGKEILITKDQILFGSSPISDVLLDGNGMSLDAMLTLKDKFIITSTNPGTKVLVNGFPFESKQIRLGDILRINGEMFTFEHSHYEDEVEDKKPILSIVKAPAAKVKAPAAKVKAPAAKVKAPAAKVKAPAAKVKAPAAKVKAPVAKVEAPVAKVEAPAAKVEAPAAKVEVPAAKVEVPAAKVEVPAAKVEAPIAKVEAPTAKVEELTKKDSKLEEMEKALLAKEKALLEKEKALLAKEKSLDEEKVISVMEAPKKKEKRTEVRKEVRKTRNIDGHHVYIDGESYDLNFNTNIQKNLTNSPTKNIKFVKEKFIDYEDDAPLQIFKTGKSQTSRDIVEVIFTTNGNIISFDTIALAKLDNFDKSLSRDLVNFLDLSNKTQLVVKKGSSYQVNVPSGFKALDDKVIIDARSKVILNKGPNQIMISLSKEIGDIALVSSSVRTRKDDLKTLGTAFLAFLPFLLLLLINTQKIENKTEQKVVIYKKKIVKKKKVKKKKEVQKEKVVNKSSDTQNIDKVKNKVAKKVSEKKSDISKVSNKKVAKSKSKSTKKTTRRKVNANKPSMSKRSTKAAVSKTPTRKKVSLASSFSKMMGSSQIKSKSFKSGTGASTGFGKSAGLKVARSGKLSTVGGGQSVNGLSTSSQFGNGRGYKSKGIGKSNFNSSFTRTRTVVLGSLDPKIIDRILREHLPQFKYCYQNALDSNKNLRGSIDMKFVIGGSGQVTKTNSRGKGNIPKSSVNCVNGVLRSIQFPSPKGGGIVEVTKPLNFSASNSSI